MKRMKRLLSILLAAVMCLSVTACGGGSADTGADGSKTATVSDVLKVAMAVNRQHWIHGFQRLRR